MSNAVVAATDLIDTISLRATRVFPGAWRNGVREVYQRAIANVRFARDGIKCGDLRAAFAALERIPGELRDANWQALRRLAAEGAPAEADAPTVPPPADDSERTRARVSELRTRARRARAVLSRADEKPGETWEGVIRKAVDVLEGRT